MIGQKLGSFLIDAELGAGCHGLYPTRAASGGSGTGSEYRAASHPHRPLSTCCATRMKGAESLSRLLLWPLSLRWSSSARG